MKRVLNKQKLSLKQNISKKTFLFIMNEDYLVLKGLKSKVEPRKLSMTGEVNPSDYPQSWHSIEYWVVNRDPCIYWLIPYISSLI